jgi:predicted membrane-bound spermidine synthase
MNRRWMKFAGAALGAIILGAIGSGLWAELLSPAWNHTVELIVRLFSYFSDSFKDSVYLEAAKGFHEKHSLAVLTLLLGMLTGLYVSSLMVRVIFRLERPKDAIRRVLNHKYEMYAFSFMVLSLVAMFIFMTIYSSYSNKITTRSLNSIEIVAPYVGTDEALQLRSQFHLMKTRTDYETFYRRMKAIGDKYTLQLPVSEPL